MNGEEVRLRSLLAIRTRDNKYINPRSGVKVKRRKQMMQNP